MYFSGFCLANEQELFDNLISHNDYTVSGFSYGAQKALEYVLYCKQRIDKLILLSPAYFEHSSVSFLRTQERYFIGQNINYMNQFYKNVAYPADDMIIRKYGTVGTAEDLQELLSYKWQAEKMQLIRSRGIEIEVYIGDKDKIVDSAKSLEFFTDLSDSLFLIKNAGHLLRKE